MHTTVLKYLFVNGSIYLFCYMIAQMIADMPSGPEAYVWNIPVYPLILLPMIFFNVLYLSGILGQLGDWIDKNS